MQNTVQELLEGLERKEIKHPCPYSLQSIEESKGAENRKTVDSVHCLQLRGCG